MALQYGIRTANYPLVAEDFQRNALPPQLHNLRRKLYGLTIMPERLQVVRNERRPGSRYSTLANCQFEVRAAEALMRQEGVPYIDTSRKSIEEIAATILPDTRLVRHVY
jgi:regulator of PEP synthase PpsR (kinase-PPPase family)